LAKEAVLVGSPLNNHITIKELLSNFQKNYSDIDRKFIYEVKDTTVGKYYIDNFIDIKFKFIRRIVNKKNDSKSLNRLVTGYSYTKSFLYKMKLVDSPNCKCNMAIQDINHIFWECPILSIERMVMYENLRKLKLQDPFSTEYLLGNLNKKIAAIICKFIEKSNNMLDLCL